MEIITNIKDSNHNHATALIELLKWAERCYLCTSFIDKPGMEMLLPTVIESIEQRSLEIEIYSNNDQKYTKPWVVKKLSILKSKLKSVSHFPVKPDGRRLHSKVYLFVRENDYVAIIGSANLTGNGLVANEELSIKQRGNVNSKEFNELMDYLKRLSR